MGMIYFAGGELDNALGYGNDNPICIRGYDESGNLISKIRYDNPIEIVAVEYIPDPPPPAMAPRYRYYIAGKNAAGDDVLPYVEYADHVVNYGASPPILRSEPQRIVATQDGEVFCFSKLKGYTYFLDGAYQKIFIDHFRVYNRDGYRMPGPEILVDPISFDVDAEGSLYLVGFYRNANGGNSGSLNGFTLMPGGDNEYPGSLADDIGLGADVVRKYNRDGELQWTIPGQSAVYYYYYNGDENVGGLDEVALDYVSALAFDSEGYLYVAGYSQYVPEATPSSTENPWTRAYGRPVRIRKIDPDDGAVIWDEFYGPYELDDWSIGVELRIYSIDLIIENDVLYASWMESVYKIDTDGVILADTTAALSSGLDGSGVHSFVYPFPGNFFYMDGKLFRDTLYFSVENPLNLQIYDADDLSFISYRAFSNGIVSKAFNNVIYTGGRYPHSTGTYSLAFWHYRTQDLNGDPVWAGEGLAGPGYLGLVAGDSDGVSFVTGAPWPSYYEVGLWIDGYFVYIPWDEWYADYLRYTDAYGRNVGPDWGGNLSESAVITGDWRARSISAIADTSIPSLAIPLALGLPTIQGDLTIDAPALPLAIGPALPFTRREYVGRPLPTVTRVTVETLSLPLISVSARYSADELVIDVIAGFTGLEQAEALISAVGDLLTVWRGPRFPDGTEVLEMLLEAPLTSSRLDAGPRSARLSLTARQALPPLVYRTRTLAGVSWIGDGQARAVVDPFLRPGDTAIVDGESWMVSALNYVMTAISADMDVQRS